jgi:hypothetical protein
MIGQTISHYRVIAQLGVIPQLVRDALHILGSQVGGGEQRLQALIVEGAAAATELPGNELAQAAARWVVDGPSRSG